MKSLLLSTSQQNKLIQNEVERRRTIRLLQTRQIEKQRAAQLRQTVADEKKKKTLHLINQLKDDWVQQKTELHENLEYQFRENLMEMGKGHREAADQPDYEQEWLKKTSENESRAVERGQQALEKLHSDLMQSENERNLHILHRKAALELEKVRAQRIAKLPPPEDPIRDLQTKPTTVVTVHDPYNFTTSRYHLEERLVTKEDEEGDAAQDAVVEQEKVDVYVSDKQRLWNEQQEKARVRGDTALKREVLDNAYDNVLGELSKLERQDRDRRQKEIQNLPKSIFIPPWRREEEREEKQRKMETAFEQVYQDNHRKQPIPIVLMNEDEEVEKLDDEENEAENDRTLIAEDEQQKEEVEYRMATITPTVANTKPVVDEAQDDDEATLADPTIMTLQTPLPDPNVLKQQQQRNMQRLMEKIERQRRAAQHRASQQAIITPINKTPKKIVVSPGYEESSTNATEISTSQNDSPEEQSSSNTTTAEIEDRRIQLESRKKALEDQIRILSERASSMPPVSIGHVPSSSSDLSLESLLRNLKSNSNTTSLPSTSSSIAAGRHQEDEHELFVQAVQAIVTSDESQFHSNSSASSITGEMRIDDDDGSQPSTSGRSQLNKYVFDRYESHSSEDRDHSLEDLISRLIATQQQSSHPDSANLLTDLLQSETTAHNSHQMQAPLIIDDLVDDVVSSVSSLSVRTPVDQRSISPPEHVHLLPTNDFDEFVFETQDETPFHEEKRLIEQELEFIRRERENLLQEHEKYRQQTLQTAMKMPQIQAPPPPPSLLRSRLNVGNTNEIHELSTIQEVDTPVSSRNTSVFHHRSPLKSSFDLQQLERISSADSSAASSSERDAVVISSQPLLLSNQNNQQAAAATGLERDDSGISLIDGPRSSATSRTTLGGGNSATGGGKSSSSGIQSILTSTTRQPRVRTTTNDTVTTTNTSTSANMPVVVTTPRSNTESDDQSLSSVSRKWRDILANECLPQLPQASNTFLNSVIDDQPLLTSSLGFGPSNTQNTLIPPSSNSLLEHYSSPSTPNLPSQEQILRSQYENEQCDLMSLIKVHEYLTKQHPTSNLTNVEQLNPPLSASTPPIHHSSYSTLTSVTYRSSLAKPVPISSGPPISTPSHTSMSSDLNINPLAMDGHDRPSSMMSDIHHLTRSPNTFESSMLSNSSMNSRNQNQDTLSYLIEQNQRAMQRLITDHQQVLPTESTTFYSSASMRAPDYESGSLTFMTTMGTSNEAAQQKSTFIETGSLSTMDFPSILLGAEEKLKIQKVKAQTNISAEDRGILDEPSITLLSNSYRSITASHTASEQVPTVAFAHSNSQQAHKKKQCSSPLSTCGDKTSACSTPSLSPIKNEISIHIEKHSREVSSTPVFLALPAISGQSPLPAPSSSSSTTISLSMSNRSNKIIGKRENYVENTSLLSFERHELSAGDTTLSSSNEKHDSLQMEFNPTSTTVPRPHSTTAIGPKADWSYFVSVGQMPTQNNQNVIGTQSSTSSSSLSTDSSDNQFADLQSAHQEHNGGVEFFIKDKTNRVGNSDATQIPTLQEALKNRRSDFLATSQRRVNEIKEKDYSAYVAQSLQKQNLRPKSTPPISKSASASSMVLVETDGDERQRRARESKERSKRLYDQLAEVQQKKKFNESKQKAHEYRARMTAFQANLDNKNKVTSTKK